MTDPLTGLPTHKDFPAAIARLPGPDVEAVLVDIAGLIWVNDQYGFEAGDGTIRTVSELITRAAEAYRGEAYRFGGEEFLVLLPGVSHDDALRLATFIVEGCAALKLPYKRLDHPRDFVALNAVVTRLGPDRLEDVPALREHLAQRIYEAARTEGRRYALVIDDR